MKIQLQVVNQKLPAGLEDKGAEFFVSPETGKIRCLHAGSVLEWDQIPDYLLEIVADDLAKHPEAIKAIKDWNIHDSDEMLQQYIFCRFGGFDYEADISTCGNILYTEYFDCGKRGLCKYEGKVCATIMVGTDIDGNTQYLTKRELEILKLVANGKIDKEIADILNIEEETVKTHTQNIRSKGNFARRPDMTAFAVAKNLI